MIIYIKKSINIVYSTSNTLMYIMNFTLLYFYYIFIIIFIIIIFNRKKIQERKEQHKQEKEYIKQRKEHEKISIEKQIEIKKKLNDFRQVNNIIYSYIDFYICF